MSADDINAADADGNTLLHAAAAKGDAALVEEYLRRGAKALTYNNRNECPRDVARAWGYDAMAQRLDAQMKLEKSASPAPLISYSSLEEIRAAGALHGLAMRGQMDQVLVLAEKDSAGLTAQDLLAIGADGESVILKICQQGQLSLLLKRELWTKNLPDLSAVWASVPKVYKEGLDIEGLISKTRQAKLQPRGGNPLRKPSGKKPS